MRRFKLSFVLPILLLSQFGCGSSKEPAYFALASRGAAARAGAPALIEIRRPGLAGYLDRADVVKRVSGYRLNVDADERWGEPLGDMIGRVLADDLTARLSGSQVFTEAGAIAAPPDVTVGVDILRFEGAEDGNVTLAAAVSVEGPKNSGQARVQRFTLQGHPSGNDTAALVATMSGLIGDLSDNIAAMLVTRSPN